MHWCQSYPAISHSVSVSVFIAPTSSFTPLPSAPSLSLISIHRAPALWILSGSLPFSDQAPMSSLLASTAAARTGVPCCLAGDHHVNVSHFQLCSTGSRRSVFADGVTAICAAALIREPRSVFLSEPLKASETRITVVNFFSVNNAFQRRTKKNPVLFNRQVLSYSSVQLTGFLKEQLEKIHVGLKIRIISYRKTRREVFSF